MIKDIEAESINFIVSMLDSQAIYIMSRLPKSERPLFMATLNSIRNLCVTSASLASLQNNLSSFSEDNLRERPLIIRIFSNPLPTKRLAFDIAQDVVNSVNLRFVDGGSKTYITLLEGKYSK
jgi:hypothetical protein